MIRTAFISILALAACSDDSPASGTITATVYGEEFIEEGIPAADFSDGWAISFDTFLVSIGNVRGQAGHDSEEVGDTAFRIVDLAQASGGDGYELATFDAPGGTYDHYGYQLFPDADATGVNVDAAAVTAMKAGGYSVWTTGSATKGGVTKTFDWGFAIKLTYGHCDLDTTLDGGNITAQATIHADHLFYDDAVSEEPELAFDLIAGADANSDDDVTLAELAAVDIRGETRYQTGSIKAVDGSAITNLRQYIEHQVVTLGHINGEGHCEDQVGAL